MYFLIVWFVGWQMSVTCIHIYYDGTPDSDDQVSKYVWAFFWPGVLLFSLLFLIIMTVVRMLGCNVRDIK